MAISRNPKRILDAYRSTHFRPLEKIRGIFGDPKARIITLVRRSKKQSATSVVEHTLSGMTRNCDESAICPVATHAPIWKSRFGEHRKRGVWLCCMATRKANQLFIFASCKTSSKSGLLEATTASLRCL